MDITGLSTVAALGAAFLAGIISFASPCVAPLLPGYVAFLTGESSHSRSVSLTRSLAFVLGFTLLFVALGASAASVSQALHAHRDIIELISGTCVALVGIALVFDRSIVPHAAARAGHAQATRRGSPTTLVVAALVGAAFAVAWTPCIGPVLATILAFAARSEHATWGAVLLLCYGLGLGVPFLVGAVALDQLQRRSRAIVRHAATVRRVAGVVLTIMGIAMATGLFGVVASHIARTVPRWMT